VSARGYSNTDCAVSPDGTRIAFQSSRLGGADIYVVNGDGSAEAQISNTPGTILEEHPVWSASGDRLLFRRRIVVGQDSLMLSRSNGLDPTRASESATNITRRRRR